MAFLFVESSPHNNSVVQSVMRALKLLFLSAGLISTLLMVKGALMPYSSEIVFSNLVGFWNSIRCFSSSPLYICIIINSMVLLIAATSTFHRHETDDHDPPPPPPPPPPPRDVTSITSQPPGWDATEVEPPPPGTTLLSRFENCSTSTLYQGSDHDEIKKTTHSLNVSPEISEHIEGEVATTNSLTSRKENGIKIEAELTNNMSDEKENEEDDSLEATWMAITGAKSKQLKKSETWTPRSTAAVQSLHSHSEELPSISTTSWKDLRKSETFNEAVSIRRLGGLRRDPSIGIDEFNHQVEAFIKKFNEDMRLQRQESDQRFIDMIKRGL